MENMTRINSTPEYSNEIIDSLYGFRLSITDIILHLTIKAECSILTKLHYGYLHLVSSGIAQDLLHCRNDCLFSARPDYVCP